MEEEKLIVGQLTAQEAVKERIERSYSSNENAYLTLLSLANHSYVKEILFGQKNYIILKNMI